MPWSVGRSVALCFGVSCGLGLGCAKKTSGERLRPETIALLRVPAQDIGDVCADLGAFRACWSAACVHGVCAVPRPFPSSLERHAEAFRCTGRDAARTCSLRTQFGSAFVCQGSRCVQDLPRVPDDGEWECADASGVTLCRGGNPAAALPRAQREPGWWCGTRRGSVLGERICLDPDPDFPPAPASARTCQFQVAGARLIRICLHTNEPRLGKACSESSACPVESQCVGGVCVPPTLSPNCWGDWDCASGRCRYGACREGSR